MLEKRGKILIGLVLAALVIALFFLFTASRVPDGVFYACYPNCNPAVDALMEKAFWLVLAAIAVIGIIAWRFWKPGAVAKKR